MQLGKKNTGNPGHPFDMRRRVSGHEQDYYKEPTGSLNKRLGRSGNGQNKLEEYSTCSKNPIFFVS